jgi:hypothetical protein
VGFTGFRVAKFLGFNGDANDARRLCFDQEMNWCPTLLPSGQVMYLRWEYTDTPHYFTRVLMHMNPDGTGQSQYYGGSAYWPNALYFARPLPGSSTQLVGVVSGHHGVPRMGELILFDVAKGRHKDGGAIQRIPGNGKPVLATMRDRLVQNSWPKFLHPYPLSDRLFLVAAQPTSKSLWGIYLVDIYDNRVLLKEENDQALFEPTPLRPRPRPPVVADTTQPGKTTANAYIHDIYSGPGLEGVPRGTVKSLRIYQYDYAYRKMGGHYEVGIEGPWDVRRIIGTVPVYRDGSAFFEIPANTPVAVQPLDGKGKAIQLERSWFQGMPGETVSCVGCHDNQTTTPPLRMTEASQNAPITPTPWYGPRRGFSFLREVQPVLDRHCVGCHDGGAGRTDRPNFKDITPTEAIGVNHRQFPLSYLNLHPTCAAPGPKGITTA